MSRSPQNDGTRGGDRNTGPAPPFDPDGAAVFDGVFGLPHTPEQARVILIPVPWEATVSYRAGTAGGPAAILEASRQVDLHDRETGRPYEGGIAMLPISPEIRSWSDEARRMALPVIEAGGVPVEPPDLEGADLKATRSTGAGDPSSTHRALADAARAVEQLGARLNSWVDETAGIWLDRGRLVGAVGGDHSIPFGLIRAIARRHPGMGILHLDAHADLRRAFEGLRWSHASIFWNVLQEIPEVETLVQAGIRDLGGREAALIEDSPRVTTFFEDLLRERLAAGDTWAGIAGEIVATLPQEVYVSFDIDALDPSLCPHTGTPVPGGFSFFEAVSLVRTVVESGRRIVGFDLCEVAPDPAGGSQWDANVGARILYKLIGFALRSKNAG